MEAKIDIFKALGDSNRMRILSMLSVRDLCVCEINEILNVSMSTISSHLKILRNAGLVSSKKDGRWIIYSLNKKDGRVIDIIAGCVDFISDSQEVIDDLEKLKNVSPEKCAS